MVDVYWNSSVTQDKMKGRKTNKQAAAEGGSNKSLTKHPKGGNSAFGDAHGFQTSGKGLQRTFIQVLKQ